MAWHGGPARTHTGLQYGRKATKQSISVRSERGHVSCPQPAAIWQTPRRSLAFLDACSVLTGLPQTRPANERQPGPRVGIASENRRRGPLPCSTSQRTHSKHAPGCWLRRQYQNPQRGLVLHHCLTAAGSSATTVCNRVNVTATCHGTGHVPSTARSPSTATAIMQPTGHAQHTCADSRMWL